MNNDVGKAIQELLFEYPVVVVPGLGGFTSSPNPATVDYVQGVVLPPSKKLEFNPNLVINDGVLVHHLQKASTVTAQEAGELISRFVDEIKQSLERREIVEIAQVGRLYKDYEHKIRFMPEGENFNADAFGLPSVRFAPLVKERPAASPVTATANAAVVPPAPAAAPAVENSASTVPSFDFQDSAPAAPAASAPGSFAQRLLPWLVLLAAVLLAASIYMMYGNKRKTEESIAKERLNVKPQAENGIANVTKEEATKEVPAPVQPEEQTPAPTPAPAPPKKELQDEVKKTEVPPSNGLQKTFIVVHSFGVRSNATKFAEKLSESGYTPETQKVGKLYRVGIMLPHKTASEVEAMKNELGKKFDAKPKTAKELDEQEGR